MQAWEEKYYEREEGIKEGRRTGRTEGILLAKKIFRLAAEGVQTEKIAAECGVTEEQVLEILG